MGVQRDPVAGQAGGASGTRWRPAAAGISLVVAAGLAVGGCGSSSSSSTPGCFSKASAAAQSGTAGGSVSPAPPGSAARAGGPANPAVAAGWTLPGGNLQNTRDVASAINSSNVSKLGVAWTAPIEAAYGRYATTPVVVDGVVYTQDLESNVMAIELATGQVLWRHTYSSPNAGPDGVNVANGTVYAATSHATVALSAATGRQLWSRTLIGNNREGIDMAPGYHHGTVYVSTVPVNPTVGEYLASHLPLPARFCLEPGSAGS
jgi:outer membrane protein assembly factor BamB